MSTPNHHQEEPFKDRVQLFREMIRGHYDEGNIDFILTLRGQLQRVTRNPDFTHPVDLEFLRIINEIIGDRLDE